MDNFFLQYFGDKEPPDEPDFPRRVHARVDKVEVQNERRRVFLEAIDAQKLTAAMPATDSLAQWWKTWWASAPIFVIEIDIADLPLPQGIELSDEDADDQTKGGSTSGERLYWVTLDLLPQPGAAMLYNNLFTAGRTVTISSATPTPSTDVDRLEKTFSLDSYVADKSEVDQLLSGISQVKLAAVYDVGQGSSGAACNNYGTPLLYLDLGGGVLAHSLTFPNTMINFCYTYTPPVILSHWDWDHWSSGSRFSGALGLSWLAPLQRIGAVHAAFAGKVGARLRIWPSGLPSAEGGQIKIIKCTGSGRNGSGLAVEVSGPQNEDPILFPGDARYTSIPGSLAKNYTSIVAAHHGADMRLKQAPISPGHSSSRFAYSYGNPNMFNHPRTITEQIHHRTGWPHASQGVATGIDRHTPGLGHIALAWATLKSLPSQPCCGRCSLQLQQF